MSQTGRDGVRTERDANRRLAETWPGAGGHVKRSPTWGLERCGQFGDGLEQVRDQAVVRDAEDRRLRVLVDRDDQLAVLHAGQMLDRTGDAHGDVQVRRDDLAGLA